MTDLRAICDTCGHTYEWHDRDVLRSRQRSDPGIERPCYREVGGAACRCGGFRDSGERAMPIVAGRQMRTGPNRLVLNAGITLLLVVMGLWPLCEYRAETPSIPHESSCTEMKGIRETDGREEEE